MSEDKSSALYDDIVTVNSVDPALYDMYPVKRGLRNNDGSGVIAGITNFLRKTNSTSSWLLSMQSANCPMASRPHVSCAILQRT